jgi:hypothetical protein
MPARGGGLLQASAHAGYMHRCKGVPTFLPLGRHYMHPTHAKLRARQLLSDAMLIIVIILSLCINRSASAVCGARRTLQLKTAPSETQ